MVTCNRLYFLSPGSMFAHWYEAWVQNERVVSCKSILPNRHGGSFSRSFVLLWVRPACSTHSCGVQCNLSMFVNRLYSCELDCFSACSHVFEYINYLVGARWREGSRLLQNLIQTAHFAFWKQLHSLLFADLHAVPTTIQFIATLEL